MPIDPASYRDPRGHVYKVADRIYRTILPPALADYTFVRDNAGVTRLVEEGLIIASSEVDPRVLGEDAPAGGIVVEHPRIPFVSYPYEWTFAALKAAALAHLDIQIALLDHDIVLSDATAYNIQFIGTRPVFIDILSLRRYRQDEHWLAHRQFCEQFLNPLLLYARLGIPFNSWLRGAMEGIPGDQLSRCLGMRDKLSMRTLSHVTLPAYVQSRNAAASTSAAVAAKTRGLPRSRYNALLLQLRSWIATLEARGVDGTVWRNYAGQNTYEQAETAAKHAFVAKFVAQQKLAMILDLGCNTGEFSDTALAAGASYAIGADADHGALEAGFGEHAGGGNDFLPLYQDATDPSPGMGWHSRERSSFSERCKPVDAVLALAFEHHLAIARNVPFDKIFDWIVELAPRGIIEFVPKDDPTIQHMLALREDIFNDYTEASFRSALERRARIVKSQTISQSNRVLLQYEIS